MGFEKYIIAPEALRKLDGYRSENTLIYYLNLKFQFFARR